MCFEVGRLGTGSERKRGQVPQQGFGLSNEVSGDFINYGGEDPRGAVYLGV